MTVLSDWMTSHSSVILRVLVLVGLVLPLLHVAARLLRKALARRMSDQSVMLITKGIAYIGTLVIVLMVLRELGFKLGALLGAAGIVGVAIGFASQTSLSNVISGLFLVWEKPFQVGDLITVDSDSGIVHSINLLSIYLRTYDNRLIRVPNESLIKSAVTNVTRFPIRRMDINIGVAYKEDIARVMQILKEVADANPACLDEPAPVIIFKGFGDSSLDLLVGLWFAKEDFIALRNSFLPDVKRRFDEEGIEIPFPHRTLYAGSASAPFPVRVVCSEVDAEAPGDLVALP